MNVYEQYEKGLRNHISVTCHKGITYDFMDLNTFDLGKGFWNKVNDGEYEEQEALDTFHKVADELFHVEYNGQEHVYTYKG